MAIALFFIFCLAFFLFVYPYHLYFKEQLTLFLVQGDYISGYLREPAFLVEVAGDFLTQFFLLRGVGPIVITLCLFLLWLGVKKSLEILSGSKWTGIIAILPVAAEMALSCQVEYPVSMLLGVVLSVWSFVLFTHIRNITISRIVGVLLVAVLYLIAGAHALSFVILLVTYGVVRHQPIILSVMACTLFIVIPLLTSGYFCLTPKQAFFYPIIEGYMLQEPFVFLVTEITLVVAIFFAILRLPSWAAASSAILLITAGLIISCDMRQEFVLAAACESYFGNADRVLEMDGNEKYKTYIGSYYKNLALAQSDSLPEALLQHYQPAYHGLFLEINENVGYMQAMFSVDALIECGDMAQAQHSAMLAMTFTPHQRSSRMVRKLMEISLINGDYDVANKYALLLEHTSLHGKWAKVRMARKEHLKHPFLTNIDTLFSPNDWYASIENLLESNPLNKSAVNYLLCFDLLDKNLERFKKDYDSYYYPFFGSLPPVIYQEALMICLSNAEGAENQLLLYNISDDVYKGCMNFIERYDDCKGDGLPLLERYGKTYWFYYYYAQIRE